MQSLLWHLNNSIKSNENCPICNDSKVETLIKMPIGYPIRQNHTLLYYDYAAVDIESILKFRFVLDRTAGFFLSVPWNFCPKCKNASLGVTFSDENLKRYFSNYFVRLAKSNERRKNVKEKHAMYIDTFLKEKSNILEVGSAEGYAANYLARKGHTVWVNEASYQFHNILIRENHLHFVDNISTLKKNFFDCIYLHHVFEHISRPLEYLKNLFNLLKPRGFLFIQVPDLSLQLGLYPLSLRWSIYSRFNPHILNLEIGKIITYSAFRSYYWLDALNNDHISAYTPEGLTHLLRIIGFEIKLVCQTTKDRLKFNSKRFAWPVDIENGNTPNGLTVIAKR